MKESVRKESEKRLVYLFNAMKPVCRLNLALYGHPNSGGYWEQHCERHLRAVGFQDVPNWRSVFWHPILQTLLVVYVDDFKLAGPQECLERAWTEIRDKITITDPGPVRHFLGCDQAEDVHKRDDGVAVRVMRYSMRSFLENILNLSRSIWMENQVFLTQSGTYSWIKMLGEMQVITNPNNTTSG